MSKKISKAKAKKMADQFKKEGGQAARSVNFEASQFETLLKEPGCVGIRVYNAYDEDKKQFTMFLVGTDAKGNNLLPADEFRTDGDPNSIEDDGKPCPPVCPGNDL
ncbi:MAG TPA: hypothetical protein PLV21_14030 [Cyclobacteriaceae bacterium]|nr:hypothetical protein [Cyclobacteriaceae bacterium]HRJ83004.1 hypothetical protein [Cyclobacteriaceae bacterium]